MHGPVNSNLGVRPPPQGHEIYLACHEMINGDVKEGEKHCSLKWSLAFSEMLDPFYLLPQTVTLALKPSTMFRGEMPLLMELLTNLKQDEGP